MSDRDGDIKVLAALKSAGSDLTKPAHTIHFLYFKSMDAAKSTADALRSAGYENIRVDRAVASSIWKRLFGPREFCCIAETHAVPSQANVFATTDQMTAIAEKLGGYYDGWEASVEE